MTRRTDPRTARALVPASELPSFTPVPRTCQRHDGWTPERQARFIEALADTGSVHAACKAVDMSQPGAYYLRRQPGAESFRAAWQAALDLGVQRIEDVAMDRALNGVAEPLYSYGKLIGTRTKYNDRLLMFMLRNRAPERFGASMNGGSLKGLNAVGKMEKRRLKKKWRKQWEEERAAEAAKNQVSPAEARASLARKVEALRQKVLADRTSKAEEWRTLTRETRDAFRHYVNLRARDLGTEPALPDWAASEEEVAEALRQQNEEAAASEQPLIESESDSETVSDSGPDKPGTPPSTDWRDYREKGDG